MIRNRFAPYAWGVLGYNILVILWGAFVRATGSGAGCGAHWPLCDGQVIPREPAIEQIIEFSHRMSSGVAMLLVLGLLIWAFRAYPKKHRVRLGAVLSSVIIIIEALLGAGLVLLGLVADNDSVARAFVIMLHLINTFLLLAALTLTAWWASGGAPLQLRGQGNKLGLLGVALVLMAMLGASGAITALGDTLFPSVSLVDGIRQDFDDGAHFLIQLRIIHPILAVLSSLYILAISWKYSREHSDSNAGRFAWALGCLFIVQLVLGTINVILLAPVWMQLVHLFVADSLWILLVLLSATVLVESKDAPVPVATQAQLHPHQH